MCNCYIPCRPLIHLAYGPPHPHSLGLNQACRPSGNRILPGTQGTREPAPNLFHSNELRAVYASGPGTWGGLPAGVHNGSPFCSMLGPWVQIEIQATAVHLARFGTSMRTGGKMPSLAGVGGMRQSLKQARRTGQRLWRPFGAETTSPTMSVGADFVECSTKLAPIVLLGFLPARWWGNSAQSFI